MVTSARANKGTVSIAADKGWLRLRWRYAGRRFSLYLGLPDTKANRRLAEAQATRIELDIKSGHFDLTLKSYKVQSRPSGREGVVELFEAFIEHKSKSVTASTLDKYRALLSSLKEYFKERPAAGVGIAEAEKFTDWYNSKNLAKEVIKERLGLLKACWEWAIEKDRLVDANPWVDMPSALLYFVWKWEGYR